MTTPRRWMVKNKKTERELGALWAPCNDQPEPLRETNVKPQVRGRRAEREKETLASFGLIDNEKAPVGGITSCGRTVPLEKGPFLADSQLKAERGMLRQGSSTFDDDIRVERRLSHPRREMPPTRCLHEQASKQQRAGQYLGMGSLNRGQRVDK